MGSALKGFPISTVIFCGEVATKGDKEQGNAHSPSSSNLGSQSQVLPRICYVLPQTTLSFNEQLGSAASNSQPSPRMWSIDDL